MTGPTALKQRQLIKRGWKLISVPYWEWDAFDDLDDAARRAAQRDYLREKLEASVGPETLAYQELGLPLSASLDEVRDRWKALMFDNHPDRNLHNEHSATERTQEVNKA